MWITAPFFVELQLLKFLPIIAAMGKIFANVKRECAECGPLPKNHAIKYMESLSEHIFPMYPAALAHYIERALEKICLATGLLRRHPYYPSSLISSRSSVFIEEGIKRGLRFFTIKGPWGPVGRFEMEKSGKIYSFAGLPRAEFLENAKSRIIDDKAKVKKILQNVSIPTPAGKCFGLFEIEKAMHYGEKLGFPLVAKPRSGSISHHVFLNVKNSKELRRAIRSVFSYEPYLIIERFFQNIKTYRATVVDFSQVAVVERVPAHVTGDGVHTIQELIGIKNTDPRRGRAKQKDTTLYRIVANDTTERLLEKHGYTFSSVVSSGSRVFLQEKVILDLGADLFEVTQKVHPENMELFEKVARVFNTRLVGIDFLAEDISKSWKKTRAAIGELNSLPYIDMHHFPTDGRPVNVAGFLCNLVERYY